MSYSNIAVTYHYAGYMQKGLAIREQVLPPQHPDVLSSQQNLAFLKQAIREQGAGANK